MNILQDRIRFLIGGKHWATDGEHKEAIVRKMIRAHISDSYRVGKGFVCYPFEVDLNDNGEERDTSTQSDILITSRAKPTLFKEGELVVVTPDAVRTIIEVKTKVDKSLLKTALGKLADEKQRLFLSNNVLCKVALFVFENSSITDEEVLRLLNRAAIGRPDRAIDWISIGEDRFYRYWSNSAEQVEGNTEGPAWHSYYLKQLAQAYFIHNTIVDLDESIPHEVQFLWFPIEGTKETQRKYYIELRKDVNPIAF